MADAAKFRRVASEGGALVSASFSAFRVGFGRFDAFLFGGSDYEALRSQVERAAVGHPGVWLVCLDVDADASDALPVLAVYCGGTWAFDSGLSGGIVRLGDHAGYFTC